MDVLRWRRVTATLLRFSLITSFFPNQSEPGYLGVSFLATFSAHNINNDARKGSCKQAVISPLFPTKMPDSTTTHPYNENDDTVVRSLMVHLPTATTITAPVAGSYTRSYLPLVRAG